jgi:putative membrane protein
MAKFTEEFTRQLALKAAELERLSTIEFVPVVARRSDTYSGFRLVMALIASLAALMLLGEGALRWGRVSEGLIAVFVFGAAYALVSWGPILRRVLPEKISHDAVIDEADSVFLHEEVFATRARSGVLVYISLFERQVFVIADKGLAAAVDPGYWRELGGRLAADFNSENPGTSFLAALDDLIKNVAPRFPASDDNPNEVPDGLRRR